MISTLTRDEVIKAFRAAKKRKQAWQEETQKILAQLQNEMSEAKASGYYDIE